jgi:hypothetical protein
MSRWEQCDLDDPLPEDFGNEVLGEEEEEERYEARLEMLREQRERPGYPRYDEDELEYMARTAAWQAELKAG